MQHTDTVTDSSREPADSGTETPPLPQGPTDWGEGLVDITTGPLRPTTLPIQTGDPTSFQSPQEVASFFADLDADGNPELFLGALDRDLTDDQAIGSQPIAGAAGLMATEFEPLMEDPPAALALVDDALEVIETLTITGETFQTLAADAAP